MRLCRLAFFDLIVIAVLCSSIASQEKGINPSKSEILESNFAKLAKIVDSLKMKILLQDFQRSLLENKVERLIKGGTTVIDASNPEGYQLLSTPLGLLIVSVDDVQPYLDGQKLYLRVGNPHSVAFDGFHVNASWGKKLTDTTNYDSWQSGIRTKTVPYTEKLNPGYWEEIELVLSPAKVEEIGYIEISIILNEISLLKDPD